MRAPIEVAFFLSACLLLVMFFMFMVVYVGLSEDHCSVSRFRSRTSYTFYLIVALLCPAVVMIALGNYLGEKHIPPLIITSRTIELSDPPPTDNLIYIGTDAQGRNVYWRPTDLCTVTGRILGIIIGLVCALVYAIMTVAFTERWKLSRRTS